MDMRCRLFMWKW